MSDYQEERNKLKKEYTQTQIIGAPGMILIGLGLYGVFGAKGNAFHPILNDLNTCYAMLAVGGVIAAWEAVTVFKISRKQAALDKF